MLQQISHWISSFPKLVEHTHIYYTVSHLEWECIFLKTNIFHSHSRGETVILSSESVPVVYGQVDLFSKDDLNAENNIKHK